MSKSNGPCVHIMWTVHAMKLMEFIWNDRLDEPLSWTWYAHTHIINISFSTFRQLLLVDFVVIQVWCVFWLCFLFVAFFFCSRLTIGRSSNPIFRYTFPASMSYLIFCASFSLCLFLSVVVSVSVSVSKALTIRTIRKHIQRILFHQYHAYNNWNSNVFWNFIFRIFPWLWNVVPSHEMPTSCMHRSTWCIRHLLSWEFSIK